MGLTWRIEADGEDISDRISGALEKIDVVDKSGVDSDKLTLTLANNPRDPFEVPSDGAALDVYLGLNEDPSLLGTFVVSEVDVAGAPHKMTIKAAAQPEVETDGGMSSLLAMKSRSWEPQTFGDLLESIANEHGLRPAVSTSVASIQLPHIDQRNESDAHLMTRMGRQYGVLVKPAGGRLVGVIEGTGKTAAGDPMPRFSFTMSDVTKYKASLSGTWSTPKVIAQWHSVVSLATHEVVVGDEDSSNVIRLQQGFGSEAEARAAAQATANRKVRDSRKLSLTMPGDVNLAAEVVVETSEFPPGANGTWVANSVKHQFSKAGYKCQIECAGQVE